MIEQETLLQDARQIAQQAGTYLKEKFYGGFSMKSKGVNDIVTEADYASERLIIESIKEKYPDHGILAEESGEEQHRSEYRWIVDPLDGTINFSYGIPFFGVILSVQRGDKTIVAVHHLPIMEETYTAILGGGAYLNDQKISVSSRRDPAEMILGLGDFNCGATKERQLEGNQKLLETIRNYSTGFLRTKQFGAACIDLAFVAAGRTDVLVYPTEKLNPWDVEAGKLLIEEAGGKIDAKDGMTIFSNGLMWW